MDEFNFAIASFAVVVGVGVTDIAQSLHRLLTASVAIRWSALPLLAAAYIGLVLSSVWFQLWVMKDVADALGFWSLTGLLTQALFVYLAAAAVLPDRPNHDRDMAEYYWRHRANIWLPMTLFSGGMIVHSLYFSTIMPADRLETLDWVWRIVPLPIYASMAFWRSYWLHGAGLLTLSALLIERTSDWAL